MGHIIKYLYPNKYLSYIILNIAMLLILIIVLDLNTESLKYPFIYDGDMLQVYMHIKMIITGDFPFYAYPSSDFLSLPFGFNGADFPFPAASNILFIKFLSLFSNDIFIIANSYIILSYFMAASSMFSVLRRLRVESYLAIAVSLLYALIPFHYFRIGHFWFANYFLLPITIYYLLLLWRSKPLFFIKKFNEKKYRLDLSSRNAIIVFVLILFSVWNFYYTFFFVIFAFAVTISALYYRRTRYHLFSGLLMIFIATAPFAVSMIPYTIYQSVNGKNTQVALRGAEDSERYGLKIAQMLLPVDGHNNAALSKIKEDYSAAPLINENRFAALGLFGSIGFIIMTIFMLFHERYFSTIKKLSIVAYSGVIVATIGGYSSLFALLVTPQIRGYNRISIYIATLALIVFALLLNYLIKRYLPGKILRPITSLALSLIILRIGIYDQAPAYMSFDNYKKYINSFQSDKSFVKEIENEIALEDDKKVFQLPYMFYPEHPAINGMSGYTQSVSYLHSPQIKWSYGAVRGRESDKWIKRVIKKPLKEQIEILKASGFNGLHIDRRGYKDKAKSLENDLSKILNSGPLVSKDGTKSFFKIKPTGKEIYDLSYPLEFTAGFYGWDAGFGSWGWAGGDCWLEYNNDSNSGKLLTVSFKLGTLKKRNVSIFYENEKIKSIDLDAGQSEVINLSVKARPGKNTFIFKTDTKAYLAGKGDGRRIAFSFSGMKYEIGE